MKLIILIIIGFSVFKGNCQLTIETYNLSDSLINLETNGERMIWSIGNAGTPDKYTDDYIEVTKLNELGQRTIQLGYRVINATIKGDLINYKVQPQKGDNSLTISFWIKNRGHNPMVFYKYDDRYIIYHGNITY